MLALESSETIPLSHGFWVLLLAVQVDMPEDYLLFILFGFVLLSSLD